MKSMKRSYREKFSRIPSPLSVAVDQLQSFWEFDEQITAPLHGFAGAEEYYARSSSRQYLGRIAVPTLILHARDDPFMCPDTVPADAELSNTVTLELSDHGGHIGFVSGILPWRPRYWLEQRIIEHLERMLS
jgi:predicted alpha/beta-fold hydrolase